MHGSRGGIGSPDPLVKSQKVGFLSNTGSNPLKNQEATKPTFNDGQSSAHQRNAKWPMMARFLCYLDPLSSHKKVLKVGPPSDKTFWLLACTRKLKLNFDDNSSYLL